MMKKNKQISVIAVLILLLLMPSAAAQAPISDSDEAGNANNSDAVNSVDSANQTMKVSLDEIIIQRDDVSGVIALKIGVSDVRIAYGQGEIGLMSTQTRHLGIADVYNRGGNYQERVGIPVQAIVAQRITHIGEYVDANENGLFDVNSSGLAGSWDEISSDERGHEAVVKYISFSNVDWTLSNWQEMRAEDAFELRFTLESSDLVYENNDGVGGDEQPNADDLNETLEYIAYEFRVTATKEDVQISSVPHYRVQVDNSETNGDVAILDSEEVQAFGVNASIINATWKYDQVVNGWDVGTDGNGTQRNDTRLTVISEFAFGVHMERVIGKWMHNQFGNLPAPRAVAGTGMPVQNMVRDAMPEVDYDMHGRPLNCGLAYVSGDGMPGSPPPGMTNGRKMDDSDNGSSDDANHDSDQSSDHDTDSAHRAEMVRDRMREYRDTACIQRGDPIASDEFTSPQSIRSGGLHFEDNGIRIGMIRWVSNATVDDVETEVLFQLHGARPVLPSDLSASDDSLWAGMRMVGAYNYVIGENQTHDPDFTTDVVVFETQSYGEAIEWQGAGNIVTRLLKTGVLPIILLGLIVVITIAGVVSSRRGGNQGAPMPPTAGYSLPNITDGRDGESNSEVGEWERYRS